MVLELACLRAVDRPVSSVVDAWGELVREQPAAHVEELDREYADVVERVDERRADRLGLGLRRVHGRRARHPQDPVSVDVLGDGPEARLPVPAADADDRELAVERDQRLGQLVVADRLRGIDPPLPLAVVAESPCLDERRQPRLLERAEAHRVDVERAKQLLLAEAVLPLLERRGSGNGIDPARGVHGDVLELVGDDVGALDEPVERLGVAVLADDELADLARAGVGRGVEESERQAERQSCEPEHAPELTAADARDARRHAVGSGLSSTACVCAARNRRRRSASAPSEPARMAAASRAALTAPARPIANVATGTPAGICTIDSSESIPDSAFDSTGTPRTGSVVFAAAMPGRWAAPPAPAISTRRPRSSAVPAYSKRRSGVRWADTTRCSNGTPSSSRVSAAWRIVSQSEREPMMRPTSGVAIDPSPTSPAPS